MNSFLAGAALLVLGSLLAAVVGEKWKGWLFSFYLALTGVLWLTPCLHVLMNGVTLTQVLRLAPPLGDVRLVLDPLAAFFVALIAVMSLAGAVYGSGYLQAYQKQGRSTSAHFLFLGLFIVGMAMAVVLQHALAFLVAWEIMSIASLFLVLFEHEKEETVTAGLNYFVAMHIGVALLIAAFVILYLKTGSLDFSSFAAVLSGRSVLAGGLFLLFFAGFGIKAGFIPLHTWLPRAHPAAPSHVSGMMSGIMIKIGIYGILRVITLLGQPTLGLSVFVLMVSLLSGVIGIMVAIPQHELKKLLAYSSVENIGIIGIGIGVGMLGMTFCIPAMAFWGFAGALLHVLNHSIFKALLFYCAGAVYQQTHTLNIERLGGVAKKMPLTSFFFLTGSLAISGLPPLNGFVAEFFIYTGLLQGVVARHMLVSLAAVLAMALLAAIGAMALLCFSKAFTIVFLGLPRSLEAQRVEKDPSPLMLWPLAMLATGCALIGFFPLLALRVVQQPAQILAHAALPAGQAAGLALINRLTGGLWLLVVLIAGMALWRRIWLKKKPPCQFKTWDCGYQKGSSRMQYSASSYAAPFISLVRPFLDIEEKRQLPNGLFPQRAVFTSHSHDFFEKAIINPVARGIGALLDLFSWIQRGSTQQYILYGLLFLVIAVIWGLVTGA